ncbi:hypothetical protein EST38_g11654 [Candolleomyces aberdarensis]|uniref:Uncharacterized protein n=1 Tax=Candolleomyces aberdarensis TaxID=2316362 RepID=A0A4V1Q284_9AGAR|nr:hypothetical protein EST38_g11654 [Candolleomyces aberdarensis]
MPANNKPTAQSKKTAPDRAKDKNHTKDKTPAKAKKKVAKEKPTSPAQALAQSQAAIDDALDELLRKDPASQPGSGIERPEGKAGQSGNGSRAGFKIYEQLSFAQNNRAWLNILATGSAGIVRFDLDFNLTWSKQPKQKLYGIAVYIGKQHPDVFPPGRYKDNWAEEEVAHQAFVNHQATRLRRQCGVPTGSHRKPSRAQSPPTSNPASDEDDGSESDTDSQSDNNSQTSDNDKTRPPTAAELKEFREFKKKNHRGQKRPSEAEDGAKSRYPKRPRPRAASSKKSATDNTNGGTNNDA